MYSKYIFIPTPNHVRGITRRSSARRWKVEGFHARPNPLKTLKSLPSACYVGCATLIGCVEGMPWP